MGAYSYARCSLLVCNLNAVAFECQLHVDFVWSPSHTNSRSHTHCEVEVPGKKMKVPAIGRKQLFTHTCFYGSFTVHETEYPR